jgi:predicted ATPase
MINDPGHFTGLSEELSDLRSRVRLELVETRTGLRAQPRDVGIGISQVLPVVVASLEPSAGLVAIEQPELHIHPAVQVSLGDLFARASTDNGSVFLVETHSEHLILRLLRRIRETALGELPPGLPDLTPEQLSVIYVERSDTGVKLTALPIDKTGEFTSRWPAGFFEERAGELF